MVEDQSRTKGNGERDNSIGQSKLKLHPQGQQIKPRDGPATVFEVDPMVSDIFTCRDGDYFGLVLVTNWPACPLIDMDGPYQDFLGAVKSCFQKEDIVVAASSEATSIASESSPSQISATLPLPAVYLYPTIYLHITLATFVPPTKIIGMNNSSNNKTNDNAETGSFSSNNLREAKRAEVLNLVQSASKLPGWPTEPLQLVVDSAQIGKRAGILLWKDLSGGVEAIRNCLKEAQASTESSSTTPAPFIPDIIHSTFLRFASTPQTPGKNVQEAFRYKIRGRLGKDFFHAPSKSGPLVLRANTVRLVCESTPYMHIPNDDEHVLWTGELAT